MRRNVREEPALTLKLRDIHDLHWALEDLYDERAEDLNLFEANREAIVEWMIIEIFKRAMDRCSIRVTNHFRYDEALIVLDQYRHLLVENTIRSVAEEFRHYRESTAKIMVSSKTVIIALERH